jgi:hypothetical protein
MRSETIFKRLQDSYEQRKEVASSRQREAQQRRQSAERGIAGIERDVAALDRSIVKLWHYSGAALGRAELFEIKRREAVLMSKRLGLKTDRENFLVEVAEASRAAEEHAQRRRLCARKEHKFDEVRKLFKRRRLLTTRIRTDKSLEESAIWTSIR